MNRSDAIATFIRDVQQMLATDSTQDAPLERIAARMRELVADPVIRSWQEEPIGNVHAGEPSPSIYQDESGLTLMHARFGPEAMVDVHSRGPAAGGAGQDEKGERVGAARDGARDFSARRRECAPRQEKIGRAHPSAQSPGARAPSARRACG